MQFVIFISFLAACVIARPSDEKPQYPKKFDPSIHSEMKKKVPSKEVEESSYLSYYPVGDLEILVPPKVSEGLFHEDLYRDGNPTRFAYEMIAQDPGDSLNAPQEDTYSNPDGIPSGGLEVPLEVEIVKEEPESYVSYSNPNPIVNLKMIAPEQSSYAALLTALGQLPLPLEPEIPMESELPTNLSPPSNTKPEETESSYISYEKPQASTYTDYNNSSRLDVLQPPAVA